jgi:nicotinamidase/pyrazinamidase
MPDALIVVDVQVDFCPGGKLPVPLGDRVIPKLNDYLALAKWAGIPIFASRDWHPVDTHHFAEHGGTWPPHCVQSTPGAEFHKGLVLPAGAQIVTKGLSHRDDGYSAFEGRLDVGGHVAPDGQPLADALRAARVTRVFVGGLATDYCVLRTVLDARRLGFAAVFLRDASRAVEVRRGDDVEAEMEVLRAGAWACMVEQFNPLTT